MDLNKICYFLITGASKGIGQRMAIECAKKFKPCSVIVLVARSIDGLNATKDSILEIRSDLIIKLYPIDLTSATEEELEQILQDSILDENIDKFELSFIIHNVGSLGDVTKSAKDIKDIAVITDYYKLNVFSVMLLNSMFIKKFITIKKLIVNITSKCGIEPYKSLTLYCCGKSAREMYFRVLAAEEEQQSSDTIILNYSPGPVDTDMPAEIQKFSRDEDLKKMFNNLVEQKTILTTLQTSEKFVKVLEEFKFKSGDHVDYYDDE